MIQSGLLVNVIFSSNIYAQKDLNFQYGNFPNNLAKTVEKASENPNSPEMKSLECVTYSNSASLGESREMYKHSWSKIQPIIESEEFSIDIKITIIAVEWNAIDTLNSPIPYVIDLCAKSYDETVNSYRIQATRSSCHRNDFIYLLITNSNDNNEMILFIG